MSHKPCSVLATLASSAMLALALPPSTTLAAAPAAPAIVRPELDASHVPAAEAERPLPPPRDRTSLYLGLGLGIGITGIAGMALLGGGVHLERQRQQQLSMLQASGIDPATVDLTPLDTQGRRAHAMIALGAVAGTAGLVTGGALLGLALWPGRPTTPSRRASLRLRPTMGGVRIVGRF